MVCQFLRKTAKNGKNRLANYCMYQSTSGFPSVFYINLCDSCVQRTVLYQLRRHLHTLFLYRLQQASMYIKLYIYMYIYCILFIDIQRIYTRIFSTVNIHLYIYNVYFKQIYIMTIRLQQFFLVDLPTSTLDKPKSTEVGTFLTQSPYSVLNR